MRDTGSASCRTKFLLVGLPKIQNGSEIQVETLQDYRIKIQERLTQIASQRQNSPVFLLEHGLTVEEISAIRKLICSLRLGCDNLLRENYLILLVLLTEAGYYTQAAVQTSGKSSQRH